MWPRKPGSSTSPIVLGGRRAGLGELAGDPADLHDGHADRVGEHDRHLQDDLELLPDVDGGEGPRSSRRSRPPGGGRRCRRRPGRATAVQGPGLAGEDERRVGGDLLEGALERRPRRASRLLGGGEVAPGRGGPGAHAAHQRAGSRPDQRNAVRAAARIAQRCRRLIRRSGSHSSGCAKPCAVDAARGRARGRGPPITKPRRGGSAGASVVRPAGGGTGRPRWLRAGRGEPLRRPGSWRRRPSGRRRRA